MAYYTREEWAPNIPDSDFAFWHFEVVLKYDSTRRSKGGWICHTLVTPAVRYEGNVCRAGDGHVRCIETVSASTAKECIQKMRLKLKTRRLAKELQIIA